MQDGVVIMTPRITPVNLMPIMITTQEMRLMAIRSLHL